MKLHPDAIIRELKTQGPLTYIELRSTFYSFLSKEIWVPIIELTDKGIISLVGDRYYLPEQMTTANRIEQAFEVEHPKLKL